MIKIIMHGCNGKMGQVITEIVKSDENSCIVAGIDLVDNRDNGYPVYTNIFDCDEEADVIIDFASTNSIDNLLAYATDRKLPIVLCTTGLSKEQNEQVEIASQSVAILKSANMSLGVNTLMRLLKEAAKVFTEANFDIEIVEKHHKHKLDAPSGTALALADSMNEALNNEYHYVYDRSTVRQERDAKEIGISAVRGGNIIGEHEVIFAGLDEVIEIKHTAYSKGIFANGAVSAAKYLAGKPAGKYDMSDVVNH